MLADTKQFTVSIANDRGVPLNVHIVAETEYQAIDKAYTKFACVQPDRKKYLCPKFKPQWKTKR